MQILLIILFVIAIGLSAYNLVQLNKLKIFVRGFFGRSNSKNVEQMLVKYSADVDDALKKLDELAEFSAKLHKSATASLQKIGLIRFNPFDDTGGDQSFCLAALDSKNNGFILSSIHARTGTRIYTKEVRSGISKHHLSSEEASALKKAIAVNPLAKKS